MENIFRTSLTKKELSGAITLTYKNQYLAIGSCFSEVLGDYLSYHKFQVCNQPFGTLFHPFAINNNIRNSISLNTPINQTLITEREGIYYHHDLHSSIAAEDTTTLSTIINNRKTIVNQILNQNTVLIITWGTAFAYYHKKSNEYVANCHKVPASEFEKQLIAPDAIIADTKKLIAELPTNTKIILTVSPVRHTKDTLVLNQVSKSILRYAAHCISEEYKNVSYFASYELLLDELRDYRFYTEDMIHPSPTAEKYICQQFSTHYFDQETLTTIKHVDAIQKNLAHKPLQPQSTAYLKHISKIKEQITALPDYISFKEELESLIK